MTVKRIITRGDFDGLVSSILLSEVHNVREIKFVHPKDVQDGLFDADENDIVVNVPYIPGCGLWFDHHVSEAKKTSEIGEFKGEFKMAPSAARVVYDYYEAEHKQTLDKYDDLLVAADKLDSANLTMDEVIDPKEWILLGLTIDPRSGHGPEFRQYFRWLVEYIKELPMNKVLIHKEVKRRTDQIKIDQDAFNDLLKKHTKADGNVIITDFRGLRDKPIGNRFLVYALYPEQNVEMRILNGHKGAVVVAVGHSIFKRTCNVNIGKFLNGYGGGGHKGAGTTQLPAETAEAQMAEILEALKKNEQ